MSTCNRYDDLSWLSFVKGQIDSAKAAEMKSHCDSCDECRIQLDFLQKIESIKDFYLQEPPASWTSEALAQFGLADLTEEKEVQGVLVFDSCIHDMEAVRSQRLETRRVLFDLPGFELDLALEYSGPQLDMVMGHILPKTTEPVEHFGRFSVELRIDSHLYATKPNELGEFIFRVEAPTSGDPLEIRCISEEGTCAIVLVPC
jgi:hypothetical protein